MHLLLPSAQISQKNLLYWENSCFSLPLFAFNMISMHGQSHTKVSLAEKKLSKVQLYISSVEQEC